MWFLTPPVFTYRLSKNTMETTVVFVLLLLCCAPYAQNREKCNDGSQAMNCSFQDYMYIYNKRIAKFTWCRWTANNFTRNYTFDDQYHYYVSFSNSRSEGQLTSVRICSTQELLYCLKFLYRFEKNDSVNLNLGISYDGSDGLKEILWTLASSNGANTAEVPIKTSSEFTVIFKARRLNNDRTTVAIDNIEWVKGPCKIVPSEALPDWHTTTPAVTVQSTQTSTALSSTTRDLNHTITSSDASGSNVAVIAGAVMAVLSGIIISAVVCVVIIRREQLHLCNSFHGPGHQRSNNALQMNQSENITNRLDNDNLNCEGEADRSHFHHDTVNNSADERTTQSSVYETVAGDALSPDYADTSYINVPSEHQEQAGAAGNAATSAPITNPQDTHPQEPRGIYDTLQTGSEENRIYLSLETADK